MRPFSSPPPHARRLAVCGLLVSLLLPLVASSAHAQRRIDLTLDAAVSLAMGGSYRVRQLQLGVERSRNWLESERAGLKSRVYLNMQMPEVEATSDNKWNSDLHRYEIVRENNRRMQMELTVRQPVVLFGYPTNGYLSLNNRMFRYTQLNGGRNTTFYNRYYIAYEQPFFQPNHLKYGIERASLNLEREELEFRSDLVQIFDDVADDYYGLFRLAYEERVYRDMVAHYDEAVDVARRLAAEDTSRAIEVDQVLVERANAREQLSQSRSNFRLEASRMKQRLRLDEADEIVVDPTPRIEAVPVDEDVAVDFGYSLRPELRRLAIQKRYDEIDLINARGWDAVRANLAITYGRESQDPAFRDMWAEPTNSYSVGFYVYVPIWDWGRRRYRIQAEEIGLRQSELRIEEEEEDIRSDILNAVQNLREFQQRALSMEENLDRARAIARESLRRYGAGGIGILDLLQSFRREEDTAENFVAAYLGYRKALLTLTTYTHYDYERRVPLMDRLDVDRVGAAP